MKKQYDISRLTDELSKSVFFQKPDQKEQSAPQDQTNNESVQSALAPTPGNRETRKQENQLTGKPANLQRSKPASMQATKPVNLQTRLHANLQACKQVSLQTGKQIMIEKYSSYLPHDYKRTLKRIALETDRKEYEVLIEAVEQYLENQKK